MKKICKNTLGHNTFDRRYRLAFINWPGLSRNFACISKIDHKAAFTHFPTIPKCLQQEFKTLPDAQSIALQAITV